MNTDRFQILSLDGGGLKGIFIASFLAEIEKHAKTDIVDHFDLIAGTSTGAIIALGLGLGFKSKNILDFYLDEAANIFPAQNGLSRFLMKIKRKFIRGYSSSNLEKALDKYFGRYLLGDSKKRLIIPSFDSGRADVNIYKTSHHEKLKIDYKKTILEVAMATTAAPSYFTTYINEGYIRLIDGGIWANNPAMVALAEALGYLEQEQQSIAMLSIGTTSAPISSNRIHDWCGELLWAMKSVEFLFRGQEIASTYQALQILGENRFLRVNPIVPQKKYFLDKFSKDLVGLGQSEARKQLHNVENMFLSHKAKEFIPHNTLKNMNRMED